MTNGQANRQDNGVTSSLLELLVAAKKIFVVNIFLDPENFRTQILSWTTIFLDQIFLGQKVFLELNFSFLRFFLFQNYFWPEYLFFVHEIFLTKKKSFDPTFLGPRAFIWAKILFWIQNLIWDTKFYWTYCFCMSQ